MKKKKSVLLLVSAVIGILYILYSISYWTGANIESTDTATAIGAGIATALVFPHLICAGLAMIFNTLGWAMSHRGFALTAGILYAVSMILFPPYFMFVIIETVLCFIGFARLKKLNEPEKSE